MNIIPTILCGGSGTRLWPLSRELMPKQFLKLVDASETLFQSTLKRIMSHNICQNPLIICNEAHRFLAAEQVRELGLDARLLLEPASKNTAPAIALAAMQLIENYQDAIMVVLPSDHVLEMNSDFATKLEEAAELAKANHLITFGIKPNKPETGYGYIQAKDQLAHSSAFQIAQFVEKPNTAKASEFLAAGNYYWNSGMFVFKASVYLAELKLHAPAIHQACTLAYQARTMDLDFIRIPQAPFITCPADSIDYAVMEKTQSAVIFPLEGSWSDVGSWSSLWDVQPQDDSGNVLKGDAVALETTHSLIHAENRLVVTVGMKDTIVVETSDAVLIADRHQPSERIKQLVSQLKTQNREELIGHTTVYRPWGSYETLIEGSHFKVKHIIVKPGASLSLQMHHHRSEHWVVVAGQASITRGQDTFTLNANESTYIPAMTLHRLHNPATDDLLELIEVQSGSYLGEDDIVRIEDNYGRNTPKTPSEIT